MAVSTHWPVMFLKPSRLSAVSDLCSVLIPESKDSVWSQWVSMLLNVFSFLLSYRYLLISRFIKQIFLAADSQIGTDLFEHRVEDVHTVHTGHLPCALYSGQD